VDPLILQNWFIQYQATKVHHRSQLCLTYIQQSLSNAVARANYSSLSQAGLPRRQKLHVYHSFSGIPSSLSSDFKNLHFFKDKSLLVATRNIPKSQLESFL